MIDTIGILLAIGLALGPDTPSILEIRPLEGAGAVYAVGTRATRGVTVLICDEGGQPVEGATVSFSLPAAGPGGVFASGGRTEIVTTRADGRAAVWGMRWNRTTGPFEIRIAAMKGQARTAGVVAQFLNAASETSGTNASARTGFGGHKLLWISLAAAGAAVAGIAGAARSGTSTPAAATSVASLVQIGVPSITLGHP